MSERSTADATQPVGWLPPCLRALAAHRLDPAVEAEIGPGWWDLALACHDDLRAIDPDYRFGALKQKYGAMEFQISPEGNTHALDAATDRYRELSHSICEVCGRTGERGTRGTLELTRCAQCLRAALEDDREEMARSVRFPAMRLNLYDGVERCADGEYQLQHWNSAGSFREPPLDFGDLDFVVHAIWDDSGLPDRPIEESIGVVLIGRREAVAASELLVAIDEALRRPADHILETKEWSATIRAADQLRLAMEANDPTLERRPWQRVETTQVSTARPIATTGRVRAAVRRMWRHGG